MWVRYLCVPNLVNQIYRSRHFNWATRGSEFPDVSDKNFSYNDIHPVMIQLSDIPFVSKPSNEYTKCYVKYQKRPKTFENVRGRVGGRSKIYNVHKKWRSG
jgi:hypothetical protein